MRPPPFTSAVTPPAYAIASPPIWAPAYCGLHFAPDRSSPVHDGEAVSRDRSGAEPDTRPDSERQTSPAAASVALEPPVATVDREDSGLARPSMRAKRRGVRLALGLLAADLLAALPAQSILVGVWEGAPAKAIFVGVLLLPLWSLAFRFHRLYALDRQLLRHSTVDEFPRLVAASTTATILITAVLVVSAARSPSTNELLVSAVTGFVLSFLFRGAIRNGWRRFAPRETGILIGSGDLALTTLRRLRLNSEHRLEIVGYLRSRETHQAEALEREYKLPLLGEASEAGFPPAFADVDRVLIADELLEANSIIRTLRACGLASVRVTIVPPRGEMLAAATTFNRLSDLRLIEVGAPQVSPWTFRAKRVVDVVGSLGLLATLTPAFACIAVLIRLDSRGPALFRQVRIGKGGKPFKIWKFRTMVCDAEAQLADLVDLSALADPAFKVYDDPRVTRVGRWLRRFSIDELPQLLNVLAGSMSLVGPRPEEAAVVALYTEEQRLKLAAKPGLTGPMQVYGRADLTFSERLALECEYIENVSIVVDLALLARTPGAVLRPAGAY